VALGRYAELNRNTAVKHSHLVVAPEKPRERSFAGVPAIELFETLPRLFADVKRQAAPNDRRNLHLHLSPFCLPWPSATITSPKTETT